MATETTTRTSVPVRELLTFDIYKRNQGRRVRQLTTLGLVAVAFWGIYALSDYLKNTVSVTWVATAVPAVLIFLAGWGAFRVVWGWPKFGDFLIATEAEMAKVSWSKWDELKRATVVVLVITALIALFLVTVDVLWSWILRKIGVLMPLTGSEEAMLNQIFDVFV